MEAKDIKWCPQHGYPLPCYKCGMPLSHQSQKDIFEVGRQAGRMEVVEFVEQKSNPRVVNADSSRIGFWFDYPKWQAQKKSWGIEEGKTEIWIEKLLKELLEEDRT